MVPANGQLTVKPADPVRVTLQANDPQGVNQIELNGGWLKKCVGVGIAANTNGVFAGQQQTLNPDVDNNVLTTVTLIMLIDGNWTCPGGTILERVTGTVYGTGRNYFGGVTSEQATVSFVP